MIERIGIIVADASPLITLAAADALDCLTMPGLPVLIPDMVYAEVATDLARLGARQIFEWSRAHRGRVEIVPTEVFTEYEIIRSLKPNARSSGRGERAALEVLEDRISADPELRAMLIYEDMDIQKSAYANKLLERILPLSTGEFLVELELAGRIQSADHIFDQAAKQGRNVPRQRDKASAFRSDGQARTGHQFKP